MDTAHNWFCLTLARIDQPEVFDRKLPLLVPELSRDRVNDVDAVSRVGSVTIEMSPSRDLVSRQFVFARSWLSRSWLAGSWLAGSWLGGPSLGGQVMTNLAEEHRDRDRGETWR